MDAVWVRVLEEAGRHATGREQQWLVEQLTAAKAHGEPDYTIQRVQNWKTRGVPKREYPALALALGKSIDWVAGHEAPQRPTAPRADESDAALLAAFAALPRAERDALRRQIMERAEVFRAYLREVRGEAAPAPVTTRATTNAAALAAAPAEPTTAGGLPVSFVDRRTAPPPAAHTVSYRRGVQVITTPPREELGPIHGELIGGMSRHGIDPNKPNRPAKPAKPAKKGGP